MNLLRNQNLDNLHIITAIHENVTNTPKIELFQLIYKEMTELVFYHLTNPSEIKVWKNDHNEDWNLWYEKLMDNFINNNSEWNI